MSNNTTPIKVKATTTAWTTGDYGMGRLLRAMEAGDQQKAGEAVSFSRHDMSSEGWVKIGPVTFEIEISPIEELQSQQLATLVAQLEKERADSMVRQNALTDKISKLQALSYSGPFVDPGLVDDEPF